jgi:hypothetical protein
MLLLVAVMIKLLPPDLFEIVLENSVTLSTSKPLAVI